MISYDLGKFFKKRWYWFEKPSEVLGVDMVNFFSYDNVDLPGFKKKSGLTSVIRLDKSVEELKLRMRKSFIRDQIIRGEKRGIVVGLGGSFDEYCKLDKKFRKNKGLPPYNLKPLKKSGLLFTAILDGIMLSGALAISDKRNMRALVLSSLHGVSKEKQNAVGQANRMVMWEMIKYAKQTGHQIFDLGGIDKDVGGQVTSLTEFKEAFGGVRQGNFFYHKYYSPLLRFLVKLQK